MPKFPAKVHLSKKPKNLYSINRSASASSTEREDEDNTRNEVANRVDKCSQDDVVNATVQGRPKNHGSKKLDHVKQDAREVVLIQRQQQITSGLNYFYELLNHNTSKIMRTGLRGDDLLDEDDEDVPHDFEGFSKQDIHDHRLKLRLEDEVLSSSEDDADLQKSVNETVDINESYDSSSQLETESSTNSRVISPVNEDRSPSAEEASQNLSNDNIVRKKSAKKRRMSALISQEPSNSCQDDCQSTEKADEASSSRQEEDEEDHQTSIKGIYSFYTNLMMNDYKPSVFDHVFNHTEVKCNESQTALKVSRKKSSDDEQPEKEINGTRNVEGQDSKQDTESSQDSQVESLEAILSGAIEPVKKVKKPRDVEWKQRKAAIISRTLVSIQNNWKERVEKHRLEAMEAKIVSPEVSKELSVVVGGSSVANSPLGVASPLTPSAQGLLMLAHPIKSHLKLKKQKCKSSNKPFPMPKTTSSLIGGRSGPRVKRVCRSTATGLPRATFSSKNTNKSDDDLFHDNDSQKTEKDDDDTDDNSTVDVQAIFTSKLTKNGKSPKKKSRDEDNENSPSTKSKKKKDSPKTSPEKKAPALKGVKRKLVLDDSSDEPSSPKKKKTKSVQKPKSAEKSVKNKRDSAITLTKKKKFHKKIMKASPDSQSSGLSSKSSPEKKTLKKRCGSCEGCLSTDCGSCKYCADKPKFGGPNIVKQACILRKCVDMKYRSPV